MCIYHKLQEMLDYYEYNSMHKTGGYGEPVTCVEFVQLGPRSLLPLTESGSNSLLTKVPSSV